jgi:serine/threonine-protein phosphatase 2A regulatory subunit B'
MKLIQRVKRQMGAESAVQAKPGAGGPAASKKGTGPKAQQTGARKTVDDTNPYTAIPLLRETPASERGDVLKKKLQACSITFDFTLQTFTAEKEAKRQALLELVEYVNNTRHAFNEGNIIQDVIEMVAANIFRALPAPRVGSASEDEDEPILESSWPHLQIVYEFFLRFVVSHDVDPKIAKKYIDQTFVLRLLDLFDSEDPRERDYLKTILHRIYGKIMALRLFIRKATQNLFYRIIYDSESHNGVPELLEILGSIINGFAMPLKEEHKVFLERSLIPLHKVKFLSNFHQQLSYCMLQYVEKDPRLCEPILDGLLRIWAITNASKEVLFINEVEEVLEYIQAAEFERLSVKLFTRIAKCMKSAHFQVAERALFIWNNDEIVNLINNNRGTLFPIVLGPLYNNSKQHWNGTVHGLSYNVLKLLMEADPTLFDECSSKHRLQSDQETKDTEGRDQAWEAIMAPYTSGAPAGLLEAWKLCEKKVPDINSDWSSNVRDL